MPAGGRQSGGRSKLAGRRRRRRRADPRHRSVATVLTITDFSLRHVIPKQTVYRWIRVGRLNAQNGLVILRGRTYIDPKRFGSMFSLRL